MIYYPILLPCFLNFAFDISLPLPYTPWPQLRRLLVLRQPCVPRNTRTKSASEKEREGERERQWGWRGRYTIATPTPTQDESWAKGREGACTVSWRVVTQRNKIKHAPKHIHPSRNIAYLVGNNSCLPAAPTSSSVLPPPHSSTSWRKTKTMPTTMEPMPAASLCLASFACFTCHVRELPAEGVARAS